MLCIFPEYDKYTIKDTDRKDLSYMYHSGSGGCFYFCISPQTGDNQRNNDPSPTRFVLMLLLIQTTEEVFPNVRLKDELLLRITGFSTFQFIGFKFDRER